MKGFNKVIIAGNLTRDPELKHTAGGLAVCKFGMAINRAWKDAQTGEMKEDCVFVDVDAFGKTAENIGQYMRKGSSMLVDGRLKLDQWEDKQTHQKRSKLGVVAENVTFLGDAKGSVATPTPKAAPGPAPSTDAPPVEDDVPF